MIATKKTVIEWGSAEDQANEAVNTVRIEMLLAMLEAGKTDGIPLEITPTLTERYWIDAASAQEYLDGIIAEAAKQNVVIVSARVEDHVE